MFLNLLMNIGMFTITLIVIGMDIGGLGTRQPQQKRLMDNILYQKH